jgi:hypothetical protein
MEVERNCTVPEGVGYRYRLRDRLTRLDGRASCLDPLDARFAGTEPPPDQGLLNGGGAELDASLSQALGKRDAAFCGKCLHMVKEHLRRGRGELSWPPG